MIKSIIAALVARLLSNPTTFEGAIASFNKIVDNLQAVATKAALEASKALQAKADAQQALAKAKEAHDEAVAEADAAHKLANAEVSRADAAAQKIKDLIGSV